MNKLTLGASLLVVASLSSLTSAEPGKAPPAAAPAGAAAAAPVALPAPASAAAPVALPTAAKPGPPGIRFAYKPAKVGSVATVVDKVTADMVIDAGGQKLQHRSVTEKKYTIKTLEVKDTATKVEVKYTSVIETQTSGGKSETKQHPESGKSYQVSTDATGALVVTGAKGAAVSDEERKEVVEDFDQEVGVTPRMARVVGGKTWKVSERVPLTKEDLAMLNEIKDKPVGTAGFITLVAMNKKTAVFAVELTAEMKNPMLDLQLPDLRLEATVDVASLRAQSLKMSSSMKGTAQKLPVTGTIAGEKTIKGK